MQTIRVLEFYLSFHLIHPFEAADVLTLSQDTFHISDHFSRSFDDSKWKCPASPPWKYTQHTAETWARRSLRTSQPMAKRGQSSQLSAVTNQVIQKQTNTRVHWALTGESMSSRRSTEQRSHCSKVSARCMIFLTIFSRSVCSSKRSLTTSSKACGLTRDTNDLRALKKSFFGCTASGELLSKVVLNLSFSSPNNVLILILVCC